MPSIRQAMALLSFALLFTVAHPAVAQFYLQHNLVSDIPGIADLHDDSLSNAWGLVSSPTSPWWVSNNGSGTSTVYNTMIGQPVTKVLSVTIPGGVPTGIVFNANSMASPPSFAGARFIFAGEDGSISRWNGGPSAILVIPPSDANVYKGLAIASTIAGDFLYASNFRAGTVDVFDHTFAPHNVPGAFTDPKIPNGYAPFGIRNIGGIIYVTYAKQDEAKHDDVAGEGHGFINAFTTDGTLIRRVASKGTLNSPWGLAMSPADFGKFSNDLLVGNFGNGKIHAYDPNAVLGNGEFKRRGVLHSANGPPLKIDGLWGLSFGNDHMAGPSTTLFFTAGPNGEMNGLFGSLVATTPPGNDQGDDDQGEDN
jgi:uncharacterized protein (TIGR03118 family)